jgi:DNA excision repair protein ERCC-6
MFSSSHPTPHGASHGNIPSPKQKEGQAAAILENSNTSATEVSTEGIHADNDLHLEDMDEETRLNLFATAKDQEELERAIGRQADQLLKEQADERDNKRLEKTETNKRRLLSQLQKIDQRLAQPAGSATKNLLRSEKANYETQVKNLDVELTQIKARIAERHEEDGVSAQAPAEETSNRQLVNESRRDFLIRTGKITPFSKMPQAPLTSANLADIMLDAEAGEAEIEDEEHAAHDNTTGLQNHQNLKRPGFAEDDDSDVSSVSETPVARSAKRRRLRSKLSLADDSEEARSPETVESDDAFDSALTDQQLAALGESEAEDDFMPDTDSIKKSKAKSHLIMKQKKRRRKTTENSVDEEVDDLAGLDDGNEEVYQARLQMWCQKRSAARRKAQHAPRTSQQDGSEDARAEKCEEAERENDEDEWHKPHPTLADTQFESGYRIPGDIFPSLYDYQRTGVRWLWELYSQRVGGIIGDEMGLGKTIQAVSFIAGLHYSGWLTKPVVVVCPATVMKQWVNEFHRWWPPLRVSILHTSGSGMMDVRREAEIEEQLEEEKWAQERPQKSRNQKSAKRIVDRVLRDGHVLVTTYSGLQTYANLLIGAEWDYAVLDEGHKIRNPNTAITIYCKELRTPNRVILSGTPMQNNLTELWSLFDFVFPMRLGTLVSFRDQFEIPIKLGGYANASNLQVETAARCAETLKETISPYLLQRWKADVASDLPKKTERVLFCRLTTTQREAYKQFLGSSDMQSILDGKRQSLYGIDILRKICNHPDLVEHKTLSHKAGYDYGIGSKSGKMQVVKALLEMWKKAGHKTLLFAQHRIMLDIMQKFLGKMEGFKFRRMDGNTSIKERQNLVDEFNNDPNLHVFLLTTKVGGLGVNLTGANRVIIYDPDWNPSTDVQARERAWRLGQKREVEIYRLMTAGTIEEKIYHRQVFKQILTNKILRDPKQRQTFHLRELHDLFTLGDEHGSTETGSLFKGTEIRFAKGKERTPCVPKPTTDGEHAGDSTELSRLDSIRGISRHENWNDADEQPPKEGGETDRVLSAIFSKSGLHSVHEHDAIVNSSTGKRKVQADPEIIAREARRVAAEAAKELKRAGEIARTIPVGQPTWTGLVGTSGRPEDPRPRTFGIGSRGGFGSGRGRGSAPSSSSVLANLAARQAGSSASSRASTPSSRHSTIHQPKGREFLVLIRDFLKTHGGSCYTQMLIDHFDRFCGTPQRTAEFKEMLNAIALLQPGRRGRGRWVLKDEFAN